MPRSTRLTKIRFTEGNLKGQYGYQETPCAGSSELLHLYDENGDQLDSGNGHFPSAKWEALPHSSHLEDSDDFWNAIESMQNLR